jgi:hypothetical protein
MNWHGSLGLACVVAGVAGPVGPLAGSVGQVSATRTLASYWLWDDETLEAIDLAYPGFGAWSASGRWAGQVSELSPTLISAALWAESYGGWPGEPFGHGRTDLAYAFTLDSPMLAGWACTVATMVDSGRGYEITEAGFLLRDPSGAAIAGERLRFFGLDYSASRRRDGFAWLAPGSYIVEAFARPEETDRLQRTSGSADGVIHLIAPGGPEPVLLGHRALQGPAEIDTFGSGFDTVLALYDSAGRLLAQNDDDGGLQSRVTADLEPGWCLAVVGGAGAAFAEGFGLTPGVGSGEVRLAINGEPVPARQIGPGEFQMYAFGVGHAPQATDLGMVGPAGETAIEAAATGSTGDAWGGSMTVWDAYGTPLADASFDEVEPALLTVTLGPGVYHLTVGTDGLGYAPGFEPVVSCYDCGDMCCGLIGFAGSVAGAAFAGEAGIGEDLSAHPVFFRFEIFGAPGCNAADLAEPFGTLDLADITAFIAAFMAQDPAADLDGSGVFDLADVVAFVEAFMAGCP